MRVQSIYEGPTKAVLEGITRCELLAALPPDDLGAVIGRARFVEAHDAGTLVPSGSDGVAVVLSGAAMARAADDQTWVVCAVLGQGSVWGLAGSLGHPVRGAELIALGGVTALLIPGSDLRALAVERHAVATSCMRSAASQLADAYDEVERFASTTTAERVVYRLLQLTDRWGEPDGTDRRIRVRLSMTQEVLASWARASRESTAKVLYSLRRAGVVETGRRSITILDVDRLRARDRGLYSEPVADRLLRVTG